MHLIDTHSYKLKYFFTEQLPKYAILSHNWGPEEVTFQDITGELQEAVKNKAGFKKIEYTCQQALKDGLHWAWVDTCCIDKTSSAELSEAINSMYSWYRTSDRCYAYLHDYEVEHAEENDGTALGSALDEKQFRNSRWFTRGWTLQELIAPSTIDFYSSSWKCFGTKESLADEIKCITSIEKDFLLHLKPLQKASVAKKMSWAAGRQTTRTEDIAYCLLGIFDINMPLLYGEGGKAFHRLQSEIWREHDDDSILAWTVPRDDARAFMPSDVLAASPLDFKNSAEAVPSKQQLGQVSALTKQGLKLEGAIFLINIGNGSRYSYTPVYRLKINCTVDGGMVSILAILNYQQGTAASYTRIATPDHYRTLRADFTRMDKIQAAFLSRSATEEQLRQFQFSASMARVYITTPPITWSSVAMKTEDPWRLVSDTARRLRRLELKFTALQADPNTSLRESRNPVMSFVNEDKQPGTSLYAPSALQLLFSFSEGRRQSGTLKNGFELRAALQIDGDRTVRAAYLEWKTWDDGSSQPDKQQLEETIGEALDRNDSRLSSTELVKWAEDRLEGIYCASNSDYLAEAQVDLGDGHMMTAQLRQPATHEIIGGIDHFVIDIAFDPRSQMGTGGPSPLGFRSAMSLGAGVNPSLITRPAHPKT